jgi:hypothetical protein
MLLLSIAGGLAFTYKDFQKGSIIQGNFRDVIKGNWTSFQNDLRLIKPKPRGFKAETQILDTEKKSIDPMVYNEFSIELKDIKGLEKSLLSGYT